MVYAQLRKSVYLGERLRSPFFIEALMLKKIKLYFSLFRVFFKILKDVDVYDDFLLRQSKPGKRNKLITRSLNTRVANEQRGLSKLSREDLVLYLLTTAYSEENREIFRDEVIVPAALLLLWAAEPPDQEETVNDLQDNTGAEE